MLDYPPASTLQLPRVRGEAAVRVRRDGASLRLAHLRQVGAAKAMLPQGQSVAADGDRAFEVVFLNTAGGLTGGDRLAFSLELGPQARATATTQTAERAYRSRHGAAHATIAFRVGAGAHLDWLPQETILFDAAHLDRKTEIDLAPNATCLWVESTTLGRAAMGETIGTLFFRDRRRITRAGRPVLTDPFMLDGPMIAAGAPALIPQGMRAFATVVLIAPHAPDRLAAMRDALDEAGVISAASALPGRLMLRLMAADGWPLRRQILRLIPILRPGPLPRVWQI
ncbi:urease accessory protein UreD [Paracoccus pacificus]|uniref:Urease accessory protein UreD n=1 Tax=Paracoccus pacificus TaxID=1463598 RepID=A0ABW4R341_9RHOB